MNLQNICNQVVALSKKTGIYLREENNRLTQSGIETKSFNNYVTYVDKHSEKLLIEGLSEIFPQAGFLTEEGTKELHDEEYFWIIDPLDGTTNYIHHLSPYAISIALMKKNDILLGCVYEVTLDEAFYAWKGGKAWLNGEEIKASQTKSIINSVTAHGIPYNLNPEYNFILDSIRRFYGKCTLRHLGSAASELCYVAAGRYDAYFHASLSAWDVAAGAIIVQEAGGKITDFSGKKNYIFGKEMVSTNGLIHEELLKELRAES